MVEGRVQSSRSRWSNYGNAIITESVILGEDGEEYDLWQAGGTAARNPNGGEKLSMWMSHTPPVLRVGDKVRAEVAAPRARTTFLNSRGRAPLQIMNITELAAAPAPGPVNNFAAYVRTENPTGAALFWPRRDFAIVYESGGVSTIAGDGEWVELDKAFAAWQEDSVGCGVADPNSEDTAPIELVRFDTAGRQQIEVGNDGLNLVMFREDEWCRPIEDGMEMCYNPQAAGLTTLFFVNDEKSKRNGEIVDADIEFNGVNFVVWRDGDESPSPGCGAELGNTATHEIGHFLGLDHTCWDGTPPRRETSDGEPVPRCSPAAALDEAVTEATMYNFQDCEEVKKKTLEDGDIQFVCEIYLPILEEKEGGCCRVAEPRDGMATQALFGFGLMMLGVRQVLRRRRRHEPK